MSTVGILVLVDKKPYYPKCVPCDGPAANPSHYTFIFLVERSCQGKGKSHGNYRAASACSVPIE